MELDILSNINNLVIQLNVFLGLTLGPFLLFNKSAKNKANVFFGLLVLCTTAFSISFCLHLLGLLPYLPHLNNAQYFMSFLAGPCIYFYIRSCTQTGFKLTKKNSWHFLPYLFGLIFHLPYFIKSGDEKMALFQHFVETKIPNDNPIFTAFLFVFTLSYYFASIRHVLVYRKHLNNTTSAIDVAFHRWLLTFCVAWSLPIFGLLFSVYIGMEDNVFLLFNFGNFIFILSVYMAVLVKPALFHAFPHQMAVLKTSEIQKQKYESSNLKEAQKQKYVEKLQAFVEQEKPYQAPDLTLAQLAEQVSIPNHYLSQVINEKLHCNFLDFINGHRVKAAQEMLRDEKYSHYTIVAIAFESGFNSKSTFYSAFKKVTKQTPSAYRKEAVAA